MPEPEDGTTKKPEPISDKEPDDKTGSEKKEIKDQDDDGVVDQDDGVVDRVSAEELVDAAVKKASKSGAEVRQWADLSEHELATILSNPSQYKSYIPGAIAENNRRIEASVMSKVEMAMDVKSATLATPDAFDSKTALGKEVQKIVTRRTHGQILSDAIELAGYRMGKGKIDQVSRGKIVAGLKAASTTVGGSTNENETKPPSPKEMSTKEFNEMVRRTKLRL